MVLLAVSVSRVSLVRAQDILPATIIRDQGGPARLTGAFTINNVNVLDSAFQPVVVLYDDLYTVDPETNATITLESQVMGVFTSELRVGEPTTYALALPIEPRGSLNDVDQDGKEDTGVQIFAVTTIDNSYGGVFADDQDGGLGYSSTIYSSHPETLYAVIGGKYLVYAPDDRQGFPSGFGRDGLLFTEDDPIVRLPQGYTLVDLDTKPFTFDRSREPVVDLHEAEGLALDDFSAMSYTDAFDALIEKGRREYAFNDLKGMDWDALSAEFRPRVVGAEANQDADAFLFALYDLSRAIPDGHVAAYSLTSTSIEDAESEQVAGGLGLALRELSDGRILVNYLLEGGPADEAGIQLGAEITAINGQPLEEAIQAFRSVNSPYSLPEAERLDQIRFITRFPVGTRVKLAYKNPGDREITAVKLTAIEEEDSLQFSRQFVYGEAVPGYSAPVEFEFLEGGYGYARVNSFGDNLPLLIASWEYFLNLANALETPGIIIDLRLNGGGFPTFGDRMASYFFDEPIDVYYDEEYNRQTGAFFHDDYPYSLVPPDRDLRYHGEVAVLVGPGCASACEYFAYNFTLQGRAAIIGQYATNGIGGGYYETYLPEDIVFILPTVRPIDLDGNIIIEGIGIQPTVRVLVTEENMSSSEDVVLQAAVEYLDEVTD